MKTLIIIPTYNEKENIKKLIDNILIVLKKNQINGHILIVDDNSPDGTYKIIKGISNNKVHLIKRAKKLGLGTAHISGFKYGLKKNFDLLMTMDADFSHNPLYIPNIIKLIKNNDVVIGSRYITNGGTLKWSLHRKITSKGANIFAQIMLGLKSNDCTSGFRCYKSEVLRSINLDNIFSNGYSFLVEMIYKCQRKRFKIGESPIIFVDRNEGKSKISRKEIIKAFYTVMKLFFERIKRKNV